MPKVTIYSDVIGIPHTFLGVTDKNGVEIKRGFGLEKLEFGVMIKFLMMNRTIINILMRWIFPKNNMTI